MLFVAKYLSFSWQWFLCIPIFHRYSDNLHSTLLHPTMLRVGLNQELWRFFELLTIIDYIISTTICYIKRCSMWIVDVYLCTVCSLYIFIKWTDWRVISQKKGGVNQNHKKSCLFYYKPVQPTFARVGGGGGGVKCGCRVEWIARRKLWSQLHPPQFVLSIHYTRTTLAFVLCSSSF